MDEGNHAGNRPLRGPSRKKSPSAETAVPTDGNSFLLTFDVSAEDMKAGRLAVGSSAGMKRTDRASFS